jgi:hypothetical protein
MTRKRLPKKTARFIEAMECLPVVKIPDGFRSGPTRSYLIHHIMPDATEVAEQMTA